jgi:hypothetical protein
VCSACGARDADVSIRWECPPRAQLEPAGVRSVLVTKHNLDIDEVPDSLIAQMGLSGIAATATSYHCTDPAAVSVRLDELIVPKARMLELKTVTDILEGVRDGANIEPVVVFREPDAARVMLLDGEHRRRVSVKLGFVEIPCIQVSREIAEDAYRYASQRESRE